MSKCLELLIRMWQRQLKVSQGASAGGGVIFPRCASRRGGTRRHLRFDLRHPLFESAARVYGSLLFPLL